MSKAVKPSDVARTHFQKSRDGDVLHFLSRTLQAHTLDAEPQDVLAKLQNLKDALVQQENTLSSWPDSPSKARICAALAKARSQVALIVEDFQNSNHAVVRDTKVS
jgi:ribosomal protein L10